jgi:hypothetical protein
MDPIQAAHLEVAKEVYINIVKDFKMENVVTLQSEDPKQFERALGSAASFAYQAAEAFAYVYRFEDLVGE